MLRTQISLSDEQRTVLAAASARTGRSMAALIREAIDLVWIRERPAEDDIAVIRSTAGAWTRDEDGAAFVERVRSGRRPP